MNYAEAKPIISAHTSLPGQVVAEILGVSNQRVFSLVADRPDRTELVLGRRWVRTDWVASVLRSPQRRRRELVGRSKAPGGR